MAAEDLGRKFPTPDVEWGVGAQISTDVNSYIEPHVASRAETYVSFDVAVPLGSEPTGQNIIVDFYLNGVVQSSARVTISIGQARGTASFTLNMSVADQLRPQVVQMGTGTPPTAMAFGARGS